MQFLPEDNRNALIGIFFNFPRFFIIPQDDILGESVGIENFQCAGMQHVRVYTRTGVLFNSDVVFLPIYHAQDDLYSQSIWDRGCPE